MGSHGKEVTALQSDLAKLGFTDAHGHALHPDGDFGLGTKAAVENFQRAHHLTPDGVVGPATHKAIDAKLRETTQAQPPLNLADATLTLPPGNARYLQTLDAVHRLDAQQDAHRTSAATTSLQGWPWPPTPTA